MARQTGEGKTAASSSSDALADTIKRRRAALGLSLNDLASISGVSAAMLSAVERGQKSPTIRVLSHVAEALGCSISELLTAPEAVQLRISRASSRRRVVDLESGIERVSFGGVASVDGLDVVVYRLPARTDTGTFAPHREGVVEHLVVIRGTVEVHVGDSVATLTVDDSVTYAANTTHRYRNRGTAAAELVLIIDSSNADDPRRRRRADTRNTL